MQTPSRPQMSPRPSLPSPTTVLTPTPSPLAPIASIASDAPVIVATATATNVTNANAAASSHRQISHPHRRLWAAPAPQERLATVSNGSGACPCLEASTLLNCGGTVPALGLRVGGASDATRCWWEVLARLGVSKTGPTVAPTLLEPRRRRDGGRSSARQRPREERRAQREGRGASGRNRRRAPIPPQSEV